MPQKPYDWSSINDWQSTNDWSSINDWQSTTPEPSGYKTYTSPGTTITQGRDANILDTLSNWWNTNGELINPFTRSETVGMRNAPGATLYDIGEIAKQGIKKIGEFGKGAWEMSKFGELEKSGKTYSEYMKDPAAFEQKYGPAEEEFNRQLQDIQRNPYELAKAGAIALDPTGAVMGATSMGESAIQDIRNKNIGGLGVDLAMLGLGAHGIAHGLPTGEQPGLKGMEWGGVNEKARPSPFTMPEGVPERAQAEAAIKAESQARIFEMQIQQSEAKRAGDHQTATAIEQNILNEKMRVADDLRHWQPTETPTFPEMAQDQGSLNFSTYRDPVTRRFMAPPSVESGMRGGVLGPPIAELPKPIDFSGPTPTVEDMAPPSAAQPAGPAVLPGEGLREFQRRTGLGWAEAKRWWDISQANQPPVAADKTPYRSPTPAEEPPLVEPPDVPVGPTSEFPAQVEIRSPADAAMWGDRGYTPVAGARGPNGFAVWAKQGTGTAFQQTMRAQPSRPAPEGSTPIVPGQDHTIPNSRATASYIRNMERSGWTVVNDDGTNTTFRKTGPPQDEGAINIGGNQPPSQGSLGQDIRELGTGLVDTIKGLRGRNQLENISNAGRLPNDAGVIDFTKPTSQVTRGSIEDAIRTADAGELAQLALRFEAEYQNTRDAGERSQINDALGAIHQREAALRSGVSTQAPVTGTVGAPTDPTAIHPSEVNRVMREIAAETDPSAITRELGAWVDYHTDAMNEGHQHNTNASAQIIQRLHEREAELQSQGQTPSTPVGGAVHPDLARIRNITDETDIQDMIDTLRADLNDAQWSNNYDSAAEARIQNVLDHALIRQNEIQAQARQAQTPATSAPTGPTTSGSIVPLNDNSPSVMAIDRSITPHDLREHIQYWEESNRDYVQSNDERGMNYSHSLAERARARLQAMEANPGGVPTAAAQGSMYTPEAIANTIADINAIDSLDELNDLDSTWYTRNTEARYNSDQVARQGSQQILDAINERWRVVNRTQPRPVTLPPANPTTKEGRRLLAEENTRRTRIAELRIAGDTRSMQKLVDMKPFWENEQQESRQAYGVMPEGTTDETRAIKAKLKKKMDHANSMVIQINNRMEHLRNYPDTKLYSPEGRRITEHPLGKTFNEVENMPKGDVTPRIIADMQAKGYELDNTGIYQAQFKKVRPGVDEVAYQSQRTPVIPGDVPERQQTFHPSFNRLAEEAEARNPTPPQGEPPLVPRPEKGASAQMKFRQMEPSISEEQYARLRGDASDYSVNQQIDQGTRSTWQAYGEGAVKELNEKGSGPPGLRVEPSRFPGEKIIVYRNRYGEATARAVIRQNYNGELYIPSMGRDMTQPGSELHAIMVFAHAADIGAMSSGGGTISPFTANMIREAKKIVRDPVTGLVNTREETRAKIRERRRAKGEEGFIDISEISDAANQIIEKFRNGMRPATSFHDTHFILPDGIRLTHNEQNHDARAGAIGSNLGEAQSAGIIRFKPETGGGASTTQPITPQQAEVLADSTYYNYAKGIYVDVTSGPYNPDTPKSERARFFKEGTSSSTIRNWVNNRDWSNAPKLKGDEGFIRIDDIVNAYQTIAEKFGGGIGKFFEKGPKTLEHPQGTPSNFAKATGLSTAATTVLDYSMPFRQAFPMIFTPEWRKALAPMFKGGWSKELASKIDAEIRSKPLFQEHIGSDGKVIKSFAERHGLKLIEGNDISGSEYDISSNWIETGGNIPYASAAYRWGPGRLAKVSNRAASTFLNHLRANAFEKLVNSAENMSAEAISKGEARPGIFKQKFTVEQGLELSPQHNAVLGKEIADFVNTATGRAPLKTAWLPFKDVPQLNLEWAARGLKHTLFSPRGLATKVRMLNPNTYVLASPFVRKQYMKAALGGATAWFTVNQLIKGAGAITGNDVSVDTDPGSADFMKSRIGNTRLDPGAGFQQVLVALYRLAAGGSTSSATGTWHRAGSGYRAETQKDMAERFLVNKLAPMPKFAYDLATASDYKPFHVADRILQMYVPLVIQDFVELLQKDPNMLPFMIPPAIFGMGTQTYEKGESIDKFIPTEKDWMVTGGGPFDFIPGLSRNQ